MISMIAKLVIAGFIMDFERLKKKKDNRLKVFTFSFFFFSSSVLFFCWFQKFRDKQSEEPDDNELRHQWRKATDQNWLIGMAEMNRRKENRTGQRS